MDTINPEALHDLAKPSLMSVVKSAAIKLANGLQFINKIKNDLPTKEDSKLTSTVKVVGLVSNLLAQLPSDESASVRISRAFHLKETLNLSLADLIRDFNLLSEFQHVELPEDNKKSFSDRYGAIILYRHPNLGIIGVRESLSEVSSSIFHTDKFTAESVWDLIWQKVDGCVDVQYSKTAYKTFQYSKYTLDLGQQFGEAQHQVDDFIDKNSKFISMGLERSYLFLGPPGVGKTTMSQRFARAFSNRILQISAQAVFEIGDLCLIQLVQQSAAQVVLIDELDKMFSGQNEWRKGMLLSKIEKIRRCRPGLITIITANAVDSFPPALLRPGRIDDIIELDYPNAKDRYNILLGYANKYEVSFTDEILYRIAAVSDGLTGAWLKEVVMQAKVSDSRATLSLVEKMLKYSNHKPRIEDPGEPQDQKANPNIIKRGMSKEKNFIDYFKPPTGVGNPINIPTPEPEAPEEAVEPITGFDSAKDIKQLVWDSSAQKWKVT